MKGFNLRLIGSVAGITMLTATVLALLLANKAAKRLPHSAEQNLQAPQLTVTEAPQLTIKPRFRTYRQLEPIILDVEFGNNSTVPISIVMDDAPENHVILSVLDSRGHAVPKTRFGRSVGESPIDGNGKIGLLAPANVIRTRFFLNLIYDMSQPDTYTVSYCALNGDLASGKSFIINVAGQPMVPEHGGD